MTLVQLKHLIALARVGSFSKAAQAVFLTQPALSRSIRALEDEFGAPLFDRVGRRTELTPFGRDTLARARLLLFDAEELQASGRRAKDGDAGDLRVGMGSGPGAMLMTPLLMQAARHRPRLRIEISRASTDLLVQALRERALDALVVDARSLRPAPDLRTAFLYDMRGAFMVRRGHPLARRRAQPSFNDLLRYPMASTPLSDEVARVLVKRYGALAHPDEFVTLRCEEISSLVEVAKHSDAVVLAIRAAAPALVELKLQPELDASARFGLVTLARRTESAGLSVVRELMQQLLHDGPTPA
jgi:DNA-binding transcriptional LysR family regulator